MYPITFEATQPGTVYGKERIITKKSGIYGWQGDNSLHAVYLYDARGALKRNSFISTVDSQGVRTEVKLGKDESAAIVRLPITIDASCPVNVNVRQYDSKAVRLALNGNGIAMLHINDGDFTVNEFVSYNILSGSRSTMSRSNKDGISVPVDINGDLDITISQ